MLLEMDGRLYEVERVPIEDLPAWHRAHPGLVAAYRALLADSEPVVVYEPAGNEATNYTNEGR
jgi:hypothetical protein